MRAIVMLIEWMVRMMMVRLVEVRMLGDQAGGGRG
jgi:hypothetical protein